MYRVNTGLTGFFCASVLMTTSPAVSALQADGDVGVDLRYSDNAGLASSNEQEDLVTRVMVTATVSKNEGPLTGNATAEISESDYLNNTFSGQTYFRLGSVASWEQFDKRLVWNVSDYFDQTSIDSLEATTPDNTQDTNVFSLSALATLPVADRHAITVSPDFRDFSYDSSTANNQQLNLSVSWVYLLDPTISLSLNSSYGETDYEDDTSDSDNESMNLNFSVNVKRARSVYNASIGATQVETDSGVKSDGVTGSISWQHNFTGRSTIVANASSFITNSSNIFLSSSIDPNTGSFNNIQTSRDTVRDNLIRITYSRLGSAINSTIWTELRNADYDNDMQDRDVLEVGANLGYAFTPLITGSVEGVHVKTKQNANTDKKYRVNGSLGYSLSRKLTASVGLQANIYDSDIANREYDELSVTAGINYLLGK